MANVKEHPSQGHIEVVVHVVVEQRMLEHSLVRPASIHFVHIESSVWVSLEFLHRF